MDRKMIRIHLLTALVFTKSIEVEGSINDDIVQIIDNYYEKYKKLPVTMYTLEGLSNIYDNQEELENALNTMIPINGGEYYIDGISHVEEI